MRTLNGLHPRRAQALFERRLLAYARSIEGSVSREIMKAMRGYAEFDGEPGRQAQVTLDHQQAIGRILSRHYQRVFPGFGMPVLEDASKLQKQLPGEARFNELANLWIETRGATEVAQIVGTTRNQAMSIINLITREAIAEGLGQQATARRLIQAMREQGGTLSRQRAGVIARTETHMAASAAQHEAAGATGLPMRKQWASARGERTRDSHQDADGQTVPLDQPFIVDGEELMYPGDPSGSPETVINCRCVELFVID